MSASIIFRPGIRFAATACRPTALRAAAPKPAFIFRQPASAFHNQSNLGRRIMSKPNLFRSSRGQSRGYQTTLVDQTSKWRRIGVSAALFGGTLVGINLLFNGEGRTESMTPGERSYLNSSFIHMGLGVGVIAASTARLVTSGMAWRIMASNPWVFMLGGAAASIGTMMLTLNIDPANTIAKYGAWTAFNVVQAAVLSPIALMAPPAILARAGLYTLGLMSGLSIVGATAKEDKYLYIGGPLLAGSCVIIAAAFAPLVLPVTAVRTLAFTENLWLYGGLALTGGYTLYHVQAIQHRARMYERGLVKKDPIREAVQLELDFVNMFVRMVWILTSRDRNRR